MVETIVRTRHGRVRGQVGEGTISWRGIPYAAPPVGRLRWRSPVAPSDWSGVRDATRFGYRAPQVMSMELMPTLGDTFTDADTPTDEDCLFLNVTAPAGKRPGTGWPVLVWIHGGGFHWGSGAMYQGDGVHIAQRGVIVVTFNYRLGALGFLRLDRALGSEYDDAVNCGLLDQVEVLQWVQTNISEFGGDPNRVTIAGESAGGKSVVNLMATPLADNSFRAAIMQSGGENVGSMQSALAISEAMQHTLGLNRSGSRDLRHLPAEEILAAQQQVAGGVRGTWAWRATVDGKVIPTRPTTALAMGQARGIPLMAGHAFNEAGGYDSADPTAAEQATRVVQGIFGSEAEVLFDTYRRNRGGLTDRELGKALMVDERYAIPTLKLLEIQSKHADTWRYRFDGPTPGLPVDQWGFHGSDGQYIWGIDLEMASESEKLLAVAIRDTWVSFISDGAPESPLLPPWPKFDTANRHTMILDLKPRIEDDPYKAERLAWNAVTWAAGSWWLFDHQRETPAD